MYVFFLAAAALALAAILWYNQASGPAGNAPSPIETEEDADRRLRCALTGDAGLVESAAEAVRALTELMAHPELGGPGFLMIQFLPQASAEGGAAVTAQYPNICEGLYRRIVRRELDRNELIAAGVPETLLSLNPDFETESGGIVLITVQTGAPLPELTEYLNNRKNRNLALNIAAEMLRERFPALSVRVLGTDLLLSPMRNKAENSCAAVTSTDE